MAEPFLSITDFATQFGSLDAGQTAVATRLLQMTSDWIRANAPSADPTAAAQVVFEVTRDQTNLGEFSPLASFTNITAHRTEAGRFDLNAVLENVLTNRQKRYLGMALRAAPAASFAVDDYAISGLDYPTRRYSTFSPYGPNS